MIDFLLSILYSTPKLNKKKILYIVKIFDGWLFELKLYYNHEPLK